MTTSEMHQSPFAILGASSRDNRQRIVALAEEQSLLLDPDLCQTARSVLTTPRARLGAEIAWLPGLSPRRGALLLEILSTSPESIRDEPGIPALARLNLTIASLASINGDLPAPAVAELLQGVARIAESLDVETILADINADRAAAGFPEIKGYEAIEAELVNRRRHARNALRDMLDRMPSHTLIDAMTLAISEATDEGAEHAPLLLDDLVDIYAIETQTFLTEESEKIAALIGAVPEACKAGAANVAPVLDKVDEIIRQWCYVAQPVQVSSKARGIEHPDSTGVADMARSLALYLFREHNMLDGAERITELLEASFPHSVNVSELVGEDFEAIASLRMQAIADQQELEEQIAFSEDLGILSKTRLTISKDGISFGNDRYTLEEITHLRWGGTQHSVSGVPTYATYKITFGSGNRETTVTVRKSSVADAITQKLWRAVGLRLLKSLAERLGAGEEIRIGEAIVRDDSIDLFTRNLFTGRKVVRVPWTDVIIHNADGNFYIRHSKNKNLFCEFSFAETNNGRVLDTLVRIAMDQDNFERMSDLL